MTDLVGNILIVGITVVVMGGLAALVLSQPGPTSVPHTDLDVRLHPGAGDWGSGDEVVSIVHMGGEAMSRGDTRIVLTLGGAPLASLEGAALGGNFSDGRLTIGEVWRSTENGQGGTPLALVVPPGVAVEALVLGAEGRIATSTVSAGASKDCKTDTTPPQAASWTQVPPDVSTTTLGAVTVTLQVTDNCAGQNLTIAPRLYTRLNDGSNPPFTDRGPMVLAGGAWIGTIPDPGWPVQATKTLEYYASPLVDKKGNAGGTTNRTDLVQVLGVPTYASGFTATLGTVTSFAAAQSATDGGAEAEFREANTAPAPFTRDYAANVVASAGGWTNPGSALVSDDQRATNANTSPNPLVLGFADEAGNPGAISSVVLRAEVSISPWVNDMFRLQPCLGAVCGAQSPEVGGSATDVMVSFDVTDLRPGGGAWTWADVNNLNLSIIAVKNQGQDGTWRVDSAGLRVGISPPATQALSVQVDFASVPAGAVRALEMKYRVAPSTDTFRVQVWDGASWTTRGAALTDTDATEWSYLMTAAEWNGGAPRIRFIDATPSGAVQGVLWLDYARVVVA